nr:integrase, catalytic region, zinc finger, CCHC-type, peptidase aspartic, catalytic [Tanacetum cinerariifolium]
MDLCGPIRVASINGKKYILVIVDDYSQFTWVKFLASKDEARDFIIKFLKMIQVRLNTAVRNIRTDNGTEFVNQTLRDYYEQVGISHETSVARTPQKMVLLKGEIRSFLVPIEEAPATVESTGSPSSKTVDQDAPSPSTSQTTPQSQSQTIPLSAKEESRDLEISQSPRGIFLNQSKYALESLKKYEMKSCDQVDTPMAEKSKLDEDTQGKAARPTEKHLHYVKRIFRYLRGTVNRGLWYSKDYVIALTDFADADHVGCQDSRRSTSRSFQLLEDRLHIDIRYHFIKEQVDNGVVELYFVRTEYQLAVIFTKALCQERSEFLIDKLGMRSCTPETLKEPADEAEELNPGKKHRESTFQIVLDALALTPCYSAFLTTTDVPEVYMHQFWDSIHKVHGQNFDELPTNEDIVPFFKELSHTGEIKTITNIVVDQMHQPWRTFATIINRSLSGETTDTTVSKRNKIGMQTSKDDYLINTLRFVSTKEESQIYEAQLPKSMTSPEMRETKAYKTYRGYATGATPPKKARKFKKPASPKLTTVPVSPEEPTRNSKRVKRPAKKSSNAPTTWVAIRETHMMSLSKKKEKMTVEKRKGVDLLSEVALTEEAQYEEVCKKSLRDFHKTHPSGSGTVTKITSSAVKIKPSVTNEGTGAKPEVPDVTEEESTEKENEEDVEDDEEEKDDELVKTPSNSTDDEDETNVEDKDKGDEDKGMDYTTNQFDDNVNVRLNEPVNTDEGLIQKEGVDAKMINVHQGNVNLETILNQVIEYAHVTHSTITKKTKVPITISSYSSDLASKFLNFSNIPHTYA